MGLIMDGEEIGMKNAIFILHEHERSHYKSDSFENISTWEVLLWQKKIIQFRVWI